MACFFLFDMFCGPTYRLFLEKRQRCLNVGPLLEDPSAPLSFLWRKNSFIVIRSISFQYLIMLLFFYFWLSSPMENVELLHTQSGM